MASSEKDFMNKNDAQVISAMLAVIKENPVGKSIKDEKLVELCEQAIEQQVLHDREWLEKQLENLARDPGNLIVDADGKAKESQEKKPAFHEIPLTEAVAIENQEDLEPVLENHRRWMDSVLNPKAQISGGRANFKQMDLRGIEFAGLDLRGANFQGANLSGCNLFKANLSTCNLSGANLKEANLQEARLRKCNLMRADLTGANLEGVDFEGADRRFCRGLGGNDEETEPLEEVEELESTASEAPEQEAVSQAEAALETLPSDQEIPS